MSCDNIRGVDSLVEEYLIHRGFTQTFRVFQKEKSDDRTHGFHAIKIVEQIYFYIENYQISDFIDLWDFLNKRFFMHLDQENLLLLDNMKSDLIKFYLVNLVNQQKKKEMTTFFETYSHEIIADSGNSSKQLRSWYALPYMTEPEKDPEFGPYFSKKWAETLRITLHNFLSTILFKTPSPKLLLLEQWFRSDAQEETRRHLQEARHTLHEHLHREDVFEDRLFALQGALKDLVAHIHSLNMQLIPSATSIIDSSAPDRNDSTMSCPDSFRDVVTIRETMDLSHAERVLTLGQAVCELAVSCVQHSHLSSTHHHDPHTTDRSKHVKTQSKLNQIIEAELLAKVQAWLETCCQQQQQQL